MKQQQNGSSNKYQIKPYRLRNTFKLSAAQFENENQIRVQNYLYKNEGYSTMYVPMT